MSGRTKVIGLFIILIAGAAYYLARAKSSEFNYRLMKAAYDWDVFWGPRAITPTAAYDHWRRAVGRRDWPEALKYVDKLHRFEAKKLAAAERQWPQELSLLYTVDCEAGDWCQEQAVYTYDYQLPAAEKIQSGDKQFELAAGNYQSEIRFVKVGDAKWRLADF